MRSFAFGFLALLEISLFNATAAVAQQNPAVQVAPRRIAPERFPDYGVRADAPTPQKPFELTLPTSDRPLGSCERGMSPAVWLRCLRETSNLTDDALERIAARVKQEFEVRTDVSPLRRSAWSRALGESQTRWRSLRDHECQQLAMAEPNASRELLEARQICLIQRNQARTIELAARYALDVNDKSQNAAP